MAHPLHLLLYRFLPLGLAFNLEIVIPFARDAGRHLACCCCSSALRSEAAWFGAMVFTFSGFNVFNLMHMNHAAVIAHLPWLLLASSCAADVARSKRPGAGICRLRARRRLAATDRQSPVRVADIRRARRT